MVVRLAAHDKKRDTSGTMTTTTRLRGGLRLRLSLGRIARRQTFQGSIPSQGRTLKAVMNLRLGQGLVTPIFMVLVVEHDKTTGNLRQESLTR